MIPTRPLVFRRLPALVAACLCSLISVPPAQAVAVDAELLLLVDVTKSVDDTAFDVIMEGFAQSFEASATIAAIQSGSAGRIAASVVFFSDKNNQAVGVSWMEISDAASATVFANQLRSAIRPSDKNGMALAAALDFGTPLFGSEAGGPGNGYESPYQIMTLAVDGIDDNSPTGGGLSNEDVVEAARDNALASGVDQINAITIGGGTALSDYYEQYVVGGSVGGTSGAVVGTSGVATFPGVAELVVEQNVVSAVPEPEVFLLVLFGGLVLLWRRR